ncbi:hypothetical protein [Nocardioides sediminis]|uniref:hypothetical protein n=1 Tax=Nocardioides sediminis TaxID=433648 RepID=UPI000D313012|nr:hypothetical protein [Nocardioides sediminis]
MSQSEDRPVLTGLVALVAVAAVVGLLFGLAALLGTKVLGLDDSVDASADATAGSETSMYLPEPEPTETTAGTPTPEAAPSETPSDAESKPAEAISLSVGQQSVSPMQQIDLTGTYPQGEGAILQVQRFEGGAWSDFPVTVSVSNQTFATYVQTSQAGVNKFRVIDTDSDRTSNEVQVTVG